MDISKRVPRTVAVTLVLCSTLRPACVLHPPRDGQATSSTQQGAMKRKEALYSECGKSSSRTMSGPTTRRSVMRSNACPPTPRSLTAPPCAARPRISPVRNLRTTSEVISPFLQKLRPRHTARPPSASPSDQPEHFTRPFASDSVSLQGAMISRCIAGRSQHDEQPFLRRSQEAAPELPIRTTS